jgi:hypothetical protein
MLGALSLGVMQISKNMTDVNRNANSSLDVLMLRQEMTSILKDSKDCSVSLVDSIPFKKSDIDDPQSEGREIELWYSDYKTGTQRNKRRFSSTDAAYSKFGNIKITKIKLVMNNPTLPVVGDDYIPGDFSDKGIVRVEVEKSENRSIKFDISVKVHFTTDSTGNSTIQYCAGSSSSKGKTKRYLVDHSQSPVIPSCPTDWVKEDEGFSFVLSRNKLSTSSFQDLADTGSCLKVFKKIPTIECKKGACDYITPADTSTWLWGGTGTGDEISRCVICSKEDAEIKVFHSQTDLIPNCPAESTLLWTGFSLQALASDTSEVASMRLSDTGSCLKDIKNGNPQIECDKDDCETGTPNDYAQFLTSMNGGNPPSSPPDPIQISKCAVCEMD